MSTKRRNMLSLISIGLLEVGCAPVALNSATSRDRPSAPVRPEDRYRSIYYTGGPSVSSQVYPDFGKFDPEKTRRSIAIFKAIENGYIPRTILMPTEDQVDSAIDQFNKIKAKYESKETLSLEEITDLMKHSIPVLRIYFDLHSHDDSPTQGTASTVNLMRDYSLRVPPGYKAMIIQEGYCLDHELTAPLRNAILSLAPASDLIPSELLPVYNGLLNLSYKGSKASDPNIQKALWTLRAAGQPNSLASHAEDSTLQLMGRATPNGGAIFASYHNKLAEKQGASKITPASIANQQAGANQDTFAQKLFKGFMDGLTHGQSSKTTLPVDNRNFQMLTPTVATFSIGNASLKPQIEIANTGTDDIFINLENYNMVPIPEARQQRIAMTRTQLQNIRQQSLPWKFEPQEQSLLEKLTGKVDKSLLLNGARFINAQALNRLPKSVYFNSIIFKAISNPQSTRALLGAMPYLGNMLCAYEALSGLNWLTGQDLNAFERTASILGTLPGGGLLKAAVGERFAETAAQFVAGAAIPFAATGFLTNTFGNSDFIANYAPALQNMTDYYKTFTAPVDIVDNMVNRKISSDLLSSMVEIERNYKADPATASIVRSAVRDYQNLDINTLLKSSH